MKSLLLLTTAFLVHANLSWSQSSPCSAIDLGEFAPLFISSFDSCSAVENQFHCFDGNNFESYADPIISTCRDTLDPVQWYRFSVNLNARLNIHVLSEDFMGMGVQLWSSADGSCQNLVEAGLTSDNKTCVEASGGKLIAPGTSLDLLTEYFLSVHGKKTLGGGFELCMVFLEEENLCTIETSIEIIARSFGGNLDGPFLEGEEVSVCMNVNTFSPQGNGCQWLQGVIPVFGDGWSPSSFENNGQPNNTTLNGNSIPSSGLYNSSIWDWWTDVTYHHDNCLLQLGDFNQDGRVDICNPLIDPYCVGQPIEGSSVVGDCWYLEEPGGLLPPGWFASGMSGNCTSNGHPNVDWGDGSGCAGPFGPWSFCFDLQVRNTDEEIENKNDLSLGLFTFADGEIGAWPGEESTCGFDAPEIIKPLICIGELVSLEESAQICSGEIFNYLIDSQTIDAVIEFWEWEVVYSGSITGAKKGIGGSTANVVDTLINTGSNIDSVVYQMVGFGGGVCPLVINMVTVLVKPAISFVLQNDLICELGDSLLYFPAFKTEVNSLAYLWSNGTTDSVLTIVNPVPGSNISLQVTNEFGCVLVQNSEIPEENSPAFEFEAIFDSLCQEEPILLGAIIDQENPAPPYEYQWFSPCDGDTNSQTTIIGCEGLYKLTITDANGCFYTDSTPIQFLVVPDPVSIFQLTQNGQEIMVESMSQSANSVFWILGDSIISTELIDTFLFESAGDYTLGLIAQNECGVRDTSYQTFQIVITSTVADNGINLDIYPIPAGDHIVLSGTAMARIDDIYIHDLYGRVVLKTDQYIHDSKAIESTRTIDISQLRPGVYFILARNKSGQFVDQFIKQ